MADRVVEHHGVPVLVVDATGERISTEQDALDHLIGPSFEHAEIVAVPVDRLDDRFFDLRTGLAGAVLQKCVTYRRRLIVVGDITHHLEASGALTDLVRESNRGHHAWFVADLDELAARLQ
ncbi:DUF4180 domain-containing protein [Streptomyces sp. G-G2]|uniref:DUF4180 domain-containing protein n=1 Tax=Streptomyces sp. G-G2 TaxID=3046201 RepID=UPI0024BBEA0A|nr:DUF4180 domain-containing protein [Streptomyces sp. G-G2]MDJ0382097.1 DUF4180 domain-containing protein [Streptomyces sp. G-G2]